MLQLKVNEVVYNLVLLDSSKFVVSQEEPYSFLVYETQLTNIKGSDGERNYTQYTYKAIIIDNKYYGVVKAK